MDMSKDTLFRGEFEVVKDLLGAFKDGEASKRMCDKVPNKHIDRKRERKKKRKKERNTRIEGNTNERE